MSRQKKLIRKIITFIPWLIYMLRLLFTVIDELSQAGTLVILKKFNLIEKPTIKQPIL